MEAGISKLIRIFCRDKKTPLNERGFRIKSLAVSYFHMGSPTLSSALSGFTSEFGMGSGGSHSLWPPGKLVDSTKRFAESNWKAVKALGCCILNHHPNRLGVIWSSLTGN